MRMDYGVLAMRIILQSEKPAQLLDDRAEAFLATFPVTALNIITLTLQQLVLIIVFSFRKYCLLSLRRNFRITSLPSYSLSCRPTKALSRRVGDTGKRSSITSTSSIEVTLRSSPPSPLLNTISIKIRNQGGRAFKRDYKREPIGVLQYSPGTQGTQTQEDSIPDLHRVHQGLRLQLPSSPAFVRLRQVQGLHVPVPIPCLRRRQLIAMSMWHAVAWNTNTTKNF